MDAFTITEMHYLVVSLFCDLVWPLYLFALAELSSVAVCYLLCFMNIKLVLIGKSLHALIRIVV